MGQISSNKRTVRIGATVTLLAVVFSLLSGPALAVLGAGGNATAVAAVGADKTKTDKGTTTTSLDTNPIKKASDGITGLGKAIILSAVGVLGGFLFLGAIFTSRWGMLVPGLLCLIMAIFFATADEGTLKSMTGGLLS